MKIEPVTQSMIDALIAASGGYVPAMCCGLLDVDLERGRGVLDDSGRKHCLWDKACHRITVEVCVDGGVIVSRANEPDEEAPLKVKVRRVKKVRKVKTAKQEHYQGNSYVCPCCGDLVRVGFKCDCGCR